MSTRKHNNTCFGVCSYCPGTQHGNQHQSSGPKKSRVTYLFCGPTQEPILASQEKLGKGFEKNAGEWTGRLEISSRQKPQPVGEAYMAIFLPTPGFKGRIFEFWVHNRWVFHFFVRNTGVKEWTGRWVGEYVGRKASACVNGWVCRLMDGYQYAVTIILGEGEWLGDWVSEAQLVDFAK